VIVAAAESPYTRHPGDRDTEWFLADAFERVIAAAGIERGDVDGLGVASFTLAPDRTIDLAWKLGVRPRWLMDDGNGGASGIQLLHHAIRALDAGDAQTIVLLAGDRFDRESFSHLVANYNRYTAEHGADGGPNAKFARVTRAHMAAHGLGRADYGRLVVRQRAWASQNPLAVYREPMTIDDYLAAPVVVEPLHRYDCVPVVSGADALVLRLGAGGVRVRAVRALHNHDRQEGDGLTTGLAAVADDLWSAAGVTPGEVDVVSVYDDYPVMVLVQLADLAIAPDPQRFLAEDVDTLPLNTSGGQLSAGQAGCAGGLHGLVEVVTQLLGRAGDRQVDGARIGLVTGYGMIVKSYGAMANAVVLDPTPTR
jgi:acetyl-CoA acetyltransferase